MKPEFLCVGMAKSGTTWLFDNLAYNQQLHMPPLKEVNILYQIHLGKKRSLKRIFGSDADWMDDIWKTVLFNDIPVALRRGNYTKVYWLLKWLIHPRIHSRKSLKKYLGLFKGFNGVTGDISPLYYQLDASIVEDLAELIPDLKIILCLRNPAEQEWSAAKMVFKRFRNLHMDEAPQEDVLEWMSGLSETYPQIISKFARFIPEDRIHLMFFEDLKKQPVKTFENVLRFLEIQPNFDPQSCKENPNQGTKFALKDFPTYQRFLYEKHKRNIEECLIFFKNSIHEETIRNWEYNMKKVL